MDTRRTKRSRPSPPNNDEEAVSPPANVGSTFTEPQPRPSRSDTLTLTLTLTLTMTLTLTLT